MYKSNQNLAYLPTLTKFPIISPMIPRIMIIQKYKLIEKANDIITTLDIEEHDKIKSLIGIAEWCKDMAGLI